MEKIIRIGMNMEGFAEASNEERPPSGTYLVIIRESITKGAVNKVEFYPGIAKYAEDRWIYSCGTDVNVFDEGRIFSEDADGEEIVREELYAYKPVDDEFLFCPEMYC